MLSLWLRAVASDRHERNRAPRGCLRLLEKLKALPSQPRIKRQLLPAARSREQILAAASSDSGPTLIR